MYSSQEGFDFLRTTLDDDLDPTVPKITDKANHFVALGDAPDRIPKPHALHVARVKQLASLRGGFSHQRPLQAISAARPASLDGLHALPVRRPISVDLLFTNLLQPSFARQGSNDSQRPNLCCVKVFCAAFVERQNACPKGVSGGFFLTDGSRVGLDNDLDGPWILRYRPPPMRSDSCRSLLLTVLLCVASVWASDALGPTPIGVLILRNGEILTGNITKAGDRYIVAQIDGGELRIPTRDVEMQCVDIEEAYVRKRARISVSDASARLQLADWCLRCGLHAQAANELLLAQAQTPDGPQIRALERRLHSALTTGRLPDVDAVHVPAAARRSDNPPLPCPLPDEALRGFASRIQPLLLNRCGASTCHGARTASTFQLIGPGLGKTITQHNTRRNLAAVMQQLDLARPETSPLLTVPAKPHADLPAAVFGEREQAQRDLLNAWVRTAGQAATQSASVAGKPGSLPQTAPRQPIPLPLAGQTSGGVELAVRVEASVESNDDESATMLDFRDPFDPERFNRRFLNSEGQGNPIAAASAPETHPAAVARAHFLQEGFRDESGDAGGSNDERAPQSGDFPQR